MTPFSACVFSVLRDNSLKGLGDPALANDATCAEPSPPPLPPMRGKAATDQSPLLARLTRRQILPSPT